MSEPYNKNEFIDSGWIEIDLIQKIRDKKKEIKSLKGEILKLEEEKRDLERQLKEVRRRK
ncbi:MAG: hypothetical protein H6558_09070 [Lewinellaceae bacterium]|nr:hypothetical protein [Lewinellaceae bacterium]MCB9290018.1 hypothetical protein [Lewinellaceae bacterium]